MTTTVLQNARIVDPSRDLDEIGTIIVRNGKILAAGRDALNQGVRTPPSSAIAAISPPYPA
jgi:dihydroorotase